jgi:signal transduction histidine kinase
MNFDITETPTLQAVKTPDDGELVQDLHDRVEEAILEAESEADVKEAVEAQRAAGITVERLHTAARVLNETSKQLRAQTGAAAGKALDKLIDSASSGGRPDFEKAAAVAALEHRERLTSKAIERVVEHLTPIAQIARLRAAAHSLETRARAIEQAAQRRAERVLGQLREAVSDEVVLPVDMSKGVAGALVARAVELRRGALEASKNAGQLETWYMERNRKESL